MGKIDKIWHTADKTPQDYREIVSYMCNKQLEKMNTSTFHLSRKYIERWAYADELLPNIE